MGREVPAGQTAGQPPRADAGTGGAGPGAGGQVASSGLLGAPRGSSGRRDERAPAVTRPPPGEGRPGSRGRREPRAPVPPFLGDSDRGSTASPRGRGPGRGAQAVADAPAPHAGPWLPASATASPACARQGPAGPGRSHAGPQPARGCARGSRRRRRSPAVSGACPFPEELLCPARGGLGGLACVQRAAGSACLAGPRRGPRRGPGRRVVPRPAPKAPPRGALLHPRAASAFGRAARCGTLRTPTARSLPFPRSVFSVCKAEINKPSVERPRIPTWHLWEMLTVQGTTEGSQ
nr:uncharacterized protein LOC112928978 [Vulpes vulpes]